MENTTENKLIEGTYYLGDVDRTWEKHSLFSAPILFGEPGDLKLSPFRVITRDSTTYKPIAIVSRYYCLLPNEEVKEKVEAVAAERGFRLHRTSSIKANTYIAHYISEEKHEVKGDDPVYLGFTVRNSIDTTLGFGIDVFTFRGLCENGAILGLKSQVKLTGKHTKTLSILWKRLPDLIEHALYKGREVIQLYRKMPEMKVNEEIAQALQNIKLPQKYTEGLYETKDDGTLVIFPLDMWTAYNTLTERIWHTTTTDERSKYLYLTRMHTALLPVLTQ
jgi:hypothetical protein